MARLYRDTVVSCGSKISRWGSTDPWGGGGGGGLTSDAGTVRWKRMRKRNNWVPLGGAPWIRHRLYVIHGDTYRCSRVLSCREGNRAMTQIHKLLPNPWLLGPAVIHSIAVADPGFPVGGGCRPVGGRRQPPTCTLFSKNVCENERN